MLEIDTRMASAVRVGHAPRQHALGLQAQLRLMVRHWLLAPQTRGNHRPGPAQLGMQHLRRARRPRVGSDSPEQQVFGPDGRAPELAGLVAGCGQGGPRPPQEPTEARARLPPHATTPGDEMPQPFLIAYRVPLGRPRLPWYWHLPAEPEDNLNHPDQHAGAEWLRNVVLGP